MLCERIALNTASGLDGNYRGERKGKEESIPSLGAKCDDTYLRRFLETPSLESLTKSSKSDDLLCPKQTRLWTF